MGGASTVIDLDEAGRKDGDHSHPSIDLFWTGSTGFRRNLAGPNRAPVGGAARAEESTIHWIQMTGDLRPDQGDAPPHGDGLPWISPADLTAGSIALAGSLDRTLGGDSIAGVEG